MSVLIHERKEFGRVAWTLQHRPFVETFMDSHEHSTQKLCYADDQDGFRERLIVTFVDRLYIANQLSYFYSYNEPIVCLRMDDELVRAPAYTPRELLKVLHGIGYNICTNGGNEFLGTKDAEKLRHMVEVTAWAIIEDRETETGLLG